MAETPVYKRALTRGQETLVSWTRNVSGSVALLFGFALPVLLLVIAGTIDYAMALRQKTVLQGMVDSAAIAAARELSLSNSQSDQIDTIIAALVDSYIAATNDDRFTKPKVQSSVTTEPLQVEVSAVQAYASLFGKALSIGAEQLEAKAVARVTGRLNVCVLALHPSIGGALNLEESANVAGENCGVYSNSTSSLGIKATESSILKATTICSAGGVQDSGVNLMPPPFKDCPTLDDPLRDRVAPPVGACSANQLLRITSSQQLQPGTYCGGIKVSAGAIVTMQPGVYVIKDGPFQVTENARLEGKGVGIFLTGSTAQLNFDETSAVSIEAPETGDMAGLLIHSSKETTAGSQHRIYSNNAQVMVGTIYMPSSQLRIGGAAQIGGQSAYTAIVAERVLVHGGPNIVLNTKYEDTEVPVPEGIKGAGQPVSLVN